MFAPSSHSDLPYFENEKWRPSASSSAVPPASYHTKDRFRVRLVTSVLIVLVEAIPTVVVFLVYNKLADHSAAGAAALVSAALCGLSQGCIQAFKGYVDISKTMRFYSWGVFNGIWAYLWTSLLTGATDHKIVRVLCDQAIGNPLCIFFVLSYSAFWEGENIDRYLNDLYVKTLQKSLMVWPLTSVVCFFFLNQNQIIVVQSIVTFAWTLILGIINF